MLKGLLVRCVKRIILLGDLKMDAFHAQGEVPTDRR